MNMVSNQADEEGISFEPTHRVVAVSPEGEVLWVAQTYYNRAREDPQVRFADDYSGKENIRIHGQLVSHYELREA